MRRSGYQNEVPIPLLCHAGNQAIALVTPASPLSRVGTGVCLIHNHQFGTGTQELIATSICFDKIGRNNHVGIALKQGLTRTTVSFEPGCSTGEHEFGIEMEL